MALVASMHNLLLSEMDILYSSIQNISLPDKSDSQKICDFFSRFYIQTENNCCTYMLEILEGQPIKSNHTVFDSEFHEK